MNTPSDYTPMTVQDLIDGLALSKPTNLIYVRGNDGEQYEIIAVEEQGEKFTSIIPDMMIAPKRR